MLCHMDYVLDEDTSTVDVLVAILAIGTYGDQHVGLRITITRYTLATYT